MKLKFVYLFCVILISITFYSCEFGETECEGTEQNPENLPEYNQVNNSLGVGCWYDWIIYAKYKEKYTKSYLKTMNVNLEDGSTAFEFFQLSEADQGTIYVDYNLHVIRGTKAKAVVGILSLERFLENIPQNLQDQLAEVIVIAVLAELFDFDVDINDALTDIFMQVELDVWMDSSIFGAAKLTKGKKDGSADLKSSCLYSENGETYIIYAYKEGFTYADINVSKFVEETVTEEGKKIIAYGTFPENPGHYSNEYLGDTYVPLPSDIQPANQGSEIIVNQNDFIDTEIFDCGQISLNSVIDFKPVPGQQAKIYFIGDVNFFVPEKYDIPACETFNLNR